MKDFASCFTTATGLLNVRMFLFSDVLMSRQKSGEYDKRYSPHHRDLTARWIVLVDNDRNFINNFLFCAPTYLRTVVHGFANAHEYQKNRS